MISPTDLAVLENDDIVVADSGNNRVQIFRPQGRLKHIFNTKAKVIYVAVDQQSNVYCSTVDGTIEIYDRNRQLTREFPVGTGQGQCAFPIAVTYNEEIIVCDTQANIVKVYTNEGKMFHQFIPSSEDDSLGIQMTAIALDPAGQILIADGLNHVVNLYSSNGTLLSQVLRPTDDLGSVQALSVGPEGHILVTEYTTNGPHCVKIFRYGSCICHRSRGGSSKRTTPSSAKS
jgi:tripartite motif-containing protein 2/3